MIKVVIMRYPQRDGVAGVRGNALSDQPGTNLDNALSTTENIALKLKCDRPESTITDDRV